MIEHAEKIKIKKCYEYGFVKNMHRLVKYDGGKYYEVSLDNGRSMIIDSECLKDTDWGIWYTSTSNNKSSNSYHSVYCINNKTKIFLSRYLCKKYKIIADDESVVEFINENPTDLRLSNMKCSDRKRNVHIPNDIIDKNVSSFDEFSQELEKKKKR